MRRKYIFHDSRELYFASFATVNWIDVFTRKIYFDIVVDSLRYCIENKGMELYAWVIMPSHVHLIMSSGDKNLSDIMRDLKRHTSKALLKAISENVQESRREWLLWMFGRAGKRNSNNEVYQLWQQNNNDPEVLLSEVKYNELGQPVEKNLHSENSGTSFLQSVDYTYNIRGALTHINNPQLNVGGTANNNNDINDLFGMQLVYQESITEINNVARYDGNISAMIWKSVNPESNTEKVYTYRYDVAERLTDAYYGEKVSGSTFTFNSKNYEYGITYDANGNILTLKRTDNSGTTIDDLSYTYRSGYNTLRKVTDASLNNAGFKDGVNLNNEYAYNSMGDLIYDRNKGITNITYNHLYLPTEVTLTSGKIIYTYDAYGRLIKKTWTQADGVTVIKATHYINGFIYSEFYDGKKRLDHFFMQEGRVVNFGPSGGALILNYEYHIKDHLGNVRIAFDKDPLTSVARRVQERHYYAYGMALTGVLSYDFGNGNRYLFGGKEFQNDNINGVALDLYDFGPRFYDPALGQWLAQDPLLLDASPYVYCMNNPANNSDPSGGKTVLGKFFSSRGFKIVFATVEVVAGAILCFTPAAPIGVPLLASGVNFWAGVAEQTSDGLSFGEAVDATSWTLGFVGTIGSGGNNQKKPPHNSNPNPVVSSPSNNKPRTDGNGNISITCSLCDQFNDIDYSDDPRSLIASADDPPGWLKKLGAIADDFIREGSSNGFHQSIMNFYLPSQTHGVVIYGEGKGMNYNPGRPSTVKTITPVDLKDLSDDFSEHTGKWQPYQPPFWMKWDSATNDNGKSYYPTVKPRW